MARGAGQFAIEHWEAHLYHIICGVWADRRCKVCGLKWKQMNIPEQWKQAPSAVEATIRSTVTFFGSF